MVNRSEEAKYFVCRLISPRATFPMDISEEERALMGRHGQYWSGQMAEGRVVIFGPVLDPKGAWGLGILRARDESEVQALLAGDPVILAQRGFSYETLPMMTAVLPTP
jgi:uncharacterized protein YciI